MTRPSSFVCRLRHGFQLQIVNRTNQLRIPQVTRFLAEAIEYYKNLPEHPEPDFNLNYGDTEGVGRRLEYALLLSAPNNPITPRECVEAVVDAYSQAHLVQQMVENRRPWDDDVERGESDLREVVAMLDQPGGDLLAMQELFRRPPRC